MTLINKKAKKAIAKDMRKLVAKHGPELAVGIASSIVGGLIAAATDHSPKKRKKKK